MKEIEEYNADFYSDDFIKNQHFHYSEMRKLGSVIFIPMLNNFAITKHSALKQALLDHNTFSSSNGVAGDKFGSNFLKGNILASDPPKHSIMRKSMIPPLMPKDLKKIIPKIKKESENLISRLLKKDSFDVIADLAQYLPLKVVSDLVGLPDFGKKNMLKWAAAAFNSLGVQNDRGREGVKVVKELREFIKGKINLNNVKSGSWIERILMMVDAKELDELTANLIIRDYINPSLDTTISAISHLIFLLSKNFSEWKKIQENHNLCRNAVNESIRLGSPIRSFSRTTTKEVNVDNFLIPKNARVMMLFASANRDETVFQDPDKFDVNRELNSHLGFGHGIHTCVGMHLAQIEMIALLESMLPYVKRIETGTPKILMNNTISGFSMLPAKFIKFN